MTDLSQLPPPPKGQTGVTLNSLSQLPPPPSGQKGVSLSDINNGLSLREQRYSVNAEASGATFPANPNPTLASAPLEALKAVGNVPSSAWNLVKGAVQMLNPVEIYKNIKKAGEEFQALKEESGGLPQARKAFAESSIDMGKRVIESVKGLTPEKVAEWFHQTAVNDPLLIPTLIEQGASALGKGKELEKVVSKFTKPVSDLVDTGVGKTKSLAGGTTKFGVSQITGLSPQTIETVAKTPSAFSNAKMAEVSRPKLGEQVFKSIQTKIDDLSETGKAYQPIRDSKQTVIIDPKNLNTVFDKFGIKFDEAGKIIRTKDTVPMKSGDISALEDFFSIYGKDSYYDSNSFLNARTALSQLSEFDTTKSDVSNRIARELRKVYDIEGKRQLPELAKLDAQYAPQVTEFKQMKKDFLIKDIQTNEWRLKDGAYNKIANLTGKGKEQTLARLEEITPGITKDINILKAIEDIEITKGQKVGTYLRGAVGGFAASGGNPLVAAITGILTQPQIAVQAVRAYGKANIRSKQFIEGLVSNLEQGRRLTIPQQEFFKKAILAGQIPTD